MEGQINKVFKEDYNGSLFPHFVPKTTLVIVIPKMFYVVFL